VKKFVALRGATQVLNKEEDIEKQVVQLYDELLEKNGLTEGDIVSIIFSITGDIDALNPAAALRRSGRGTDLALFCVQEAFVQHGIERVIRALVHCCLEERSAPCHIYINGAEVLRPDRV
jgi:chorismate mutase